MSNREFCESICETAIGLLNEAQRSDDDTKVLLVIQTQSFFTELFSDLSSDSEFLPNIIETCHNLFIVLNESMPIFMQNPEQTKIIITLLAIFIHSEVALQLAQDLSTFVISFMFTDFYKYPTHAMYFPIIEAFLQNHQFPHVFEALGGLLAIWGILASPEKGELCPIVFNAMSQTIPFYFQTEATQDAQNFLSQVSNTIKDIPTANAPFAFQFIFDLISSSKYDLLSLFIEYNGFNNINDYIVTNNDPLLLVVYQMFRSMCHFPQENTKIPITNSVSTPTNQNNTNKAKEFSGKDMKNNLLKIRNRTFSFMKNRKKKDLPNDNQNIVSQTKEVQPQIKETPTIETPLPENQKEDGLCPILQQLFDLITHPNASSIIKYAALTNFYSALKQLIHSQIPIQPHHLVVIANTLHPGQDDSSIGLLIDILYFIKDNFESFYEVPLFSVISRLISFQGLMNFNMESLFNLLQKCKETFSVFSIYFFDDLLRPLDAKQFSMIFDKYTLFSKFIPQCLEDDLPTDSQKHLFNLFIQSGNYTTQLELYSQTLICMIQDITRKKTNLILEQLISDSISEKIRRLLIDSLIKAASDSVTLCRYLKEMDFFETIKKMYDKHQITPNDFYNFVALLAANRFNQNFDHIVFEYFKSVNFLDQSSDAILKLTFGLLQTEDHSYGRLCFPSFLSRCESFTLKSPFDRWVAARYGLDLWCKETGKTIDQFPAILDVARRFLLPHQAEQLWNYPSLFKDACNDTYGKIPLFEFPRAYDNTQLNFSTRSSFTNAISFWFFFSEYSPSNQLIISFRDSQLLTNGNELILQGTHITDFLLGRWYNVILSSDKGKLYIFIDGKLIHSVPDILQSTAPQELEIEIEAEDVEAEQIESPIFVEDNIQTIIGSETNESLWFIGGSIRFFKRSLSIDNVITIYRKGILYLPRILPSEFKTINSYLFVDNLKNINFESVELSSNSRPVISFPLSMYTDAETLFNKILETQNQDFAKALCYQQDNDRTDWSLKEFAIRMSTIFSYCPQLFINSIELTNSVLNCFSTAADRNILLNGENITNPFDWDAFLEFVLDFGLFNSSLKEFIIGRIFGFIAQYPIPISSEISLRLSRFLFYYLQLYSDPTQRDSDERREEQLRFWDLLMKLHFSSDFLARIIAASSDFVNNVSYPTLRYEPFNNSQIIYKFIDLLKTTIDKNFKHTYLIHILQPYDALDIVMKMLNAGATISHYKELMRLCLRNCDIIKSWSVALSLFSETIIDVELNPEFKITKINSDIFCSFLLMLSILVVAITKLPPDSFWTKLGKNILTQLHSVLTSTSLQIHSNDLTFVLCNLLISGKFLPAMAIYPFSPQTLEFQQISSICCQPGQPFEPSSPKLVPYPTFQVNMNDDHLASILHETIRTLLPDELIISGDKSINISSLDYNKDFCSRALIENNFEQWKDWFDFVSSIQQKFGVNVDDIDVTMTQNSEIIDLVIDFVALILLNSCNKNFGIVKTVLLNHSMVKPEHSLFITHKLTLKLFEHATTFLPSLVNFTVERISEGWFGKNTINMIITLLSHCYDFGLQQIQSQKAGSTTLDFIPFIIIHSFSILSEDDVSIYLKYLINSIGLTFSKMFIENDTYLFSFINKLIFQKNNYSMNVMGVFLPAFSKYKNDENPLSFIIDGLWCYANSGYDTLDQWFNENPESRNHFQAKIDQAKEEFNILVSTNIDNSLSTLAQIRLQYSSSFFESAHEILFKTQDDITLAHATASILRNFERVSLLSSFSLNIRNRENILTSHGRLCKDYQISPDYDKIVLPYYNIQNKADYPTDKESESTKKKIKNSTPDSGSKKVKAVSVLSDPLYPSRRIEDSPVEYVIPGFPGIKILSVALQPEIFENQFNIYPDSLQSLFSYSYRRIEELGHYSHKGKELIYSFNTPINPKIQQRIIEIIFNNGQPFTQIMNISLLYGVEPLPGILLRSQTALYYIEGMKYIFNSDNPRNNGIICDNYSPPSFLFSFYIGYFVSNNFGSFSLYSGHPVIKLDPSEIILAEKHYWLHKPTAVELNFITGTNIVLIPENVKNYKQFLSIFSKFEEENLNSLPNCLDPTYTQISPIRSAQLINEGLKECCSLWQDGIIDNFTYLCLLNRFGLRSFCDFSQYFVFPWLSRDYSTIETPLATNLWRDLSLPMGQIGEDRAPRFDIIFQDTDNKYYYGTHYMHLGVVLYFNFRIDPFCIFSLYLHHGWDHQNRMFIDVNESWLSAAYISPADVKELVPQLFCVPESLENVSQLPLTTTTEGKPISNVKLPKWATSPRDFTTKQMLFLQSDNISSSLPKWIDLIFGYKSRGEEAVKAKNVFHTFSYVAEDLSEDAVESEDPVEREAAKTCVINFGQCCFQLFKNPHPSKKGQFELSNRNLHLVSDPSLLFHQRLNPQEFPKLSDIIDIKITSNGFASATKHDGIKDYLVPPNFNQNIRIFIQGGEIKYTKGHSINSLAVGNQLWFVSAFAFSSDGVFAAVGYSQGFCEIFEVRYNSGDISTLKQIASFSPKAPNTINQIVISSEHFLVFTITDTQIDRFCLGTKQIIPPIIPQIEERFNINSVVVDENAGFIIFSLITESQKCFLNVYTVGGEKLIQKEMDSLISCLAIPQLSESVSNRFFISGDMKGCTKFWHIDFTQSSPDLIILKSVRMSELPVIVVGVDVRGLRACAITRENVYSFDFIGSPAEDMKKIYGKECFECSEDIVKKKGSLQDNIRICSHCHRFFCVKHMNLTTGERIMKTVKLVQKTKSGGKIPTTVMICPICQDLIENQMNVSD